MTLLDRALIRLTQIGDETKPEAVMHRSIITAALALVVVLPEPLRSQQSQVIGPGDWLRIAFDPDLRAEPLLVRCSAMGPDSLEFWYKGTPVSVPLDTIARVERWHGSNTVKAMLWGGGIGSGVGLVIGAFQGYAAFAGLTTAGGFVVGAVLGGVLRVGGGRWEEVPLDGLRVRPIAIRDGRFGLAASVRF